MTERIKLTKDDIQLRFITNTIRKIIINTNAIFQKDTNKFDEDENTKGAELYKQQILDDQEKAKKIDKITAFAKTLAYSNPHVSWQLKQLLKDQK